MSNYEYMLYGKRIAYFSVLFACLVAILALSGCSTLNIARTVIDVKGQEVADRVLADAEFVMCRAVPVGAWVRRYGSSPDLAAAWKTICGSELLVTPK